MAAANQGSKGALITWTVISTVFGVTCMVLAIIALSKQQQLQTRLDGTIEKYNQIATESDITGTLVSELRAEKQEAQSRQLDLVFAITQGRELASLAAGTDTVPDARTQIDNALRSANTVTDANAQSLADAASALVTKVRTLEQQQRSLQAQLEQEEQGAEQTREQLQTQIANLEQEARELQEQVNTQIARNEQAAEAMQALQEQLATQVNELQQQLGERQLELVTQLDDTVQQLARATGLNRELSAAVRSTYDPNTLTTQADGRVIRPPSDNRLTIDLGRRDGISRGMTFALYSASEGVPRLEGNPDDPTSLRLPLGKASIEVVSVGETSSQARPIREQPGAVIREGDLIANLAYDRDSTRRFFVYGEFDFNADGVFNVREAEQIRGLISEFGGEVVDGVTVDTDIVVLGREPEIPQYDEEQLRNPINRNEVLQARRRLSEYNQVRREAEGLNKTIVNQNQLLAMLGYYERARS